MYDETDTLLMAALDGRAMELFDILNEDGSKSGIVTERGVAHLEGSLHLLLTCGSYGRMNRAGMICSCKKKCL